MRDRKRILSFLIALVMALVIVPFGKMGVSRADSTENDFEATISPEGVISWEEGLTCTVWIEGGRSGYLANGNSFDLYAMCRIWSFHSGTYEVTLKSDDGGKWKGNYTYTALYGVLSAPTDLTLGDDYILSWNGDPNANQFEVGILNSSGKPTRSTYVNGQTSYNIGEFLEKDVTKEYEFFVVALSTKGYQYSEMTSLKKTLTLQLPQISNVQFDEFGQMTWDAVPGATRYKVSLNSLSGTSAMSIYPSKNSLNLAAEICDSWGKSEANGKYWVELVALNKNAEWSEVWRGSYDYKYQEFDISIFGTKIDICTLDRFGDGSVVFDPHTNTVNLNYTEGYLSIPDVVHAPPFIETDMDITIAGLLKKADDDIFIPNFIESTGKVTFAENTVISYVGVGTGIHAADVEFKSGVTFDVELQDAQEVIHADNSIVIAPDVNVFYAKVDKGTEALVAENGSIVMDGLVFELPADGMLSADKHFVLLPDGVTHATEVRLKADPNYVPVTPDPDPVTPDPQPVDPQPVKEPSFEEFIDRLYLYALLREPEADGKAFWMNKVLNEGFTGGRCAYGFLVEAQEFLNRDLTNEQFIDTLYQIFFDRAPDEGGKAFWLSKFAEGMTRAQMVNGFIDSTEWCNLCASYGVKSGAPNAKAERPSNNAIKFATRLYTECLGREYDADGLQFWALRLTNLESSGYEAALGFFTSEEFTQKGIGDDEFIHRLYRTFMGRDEDEGGFAFWKSHLGVDMTREDLIKGFAQSQEFTNICNQYGIDRGEI